MEKVATFFPDTHYHLCKISCWSFEYARYCTSTVQISAREPKGPQETGESLENLVTSVAVWLICSSVPAQSKDRVHTTCCGFRLLDCVHRCTVIPTLVLCLGLFLLAPRSLFENTTRKPQTLNEQVKTFSWTSESCEDISLCDPCSLSAFCWGMVHCADLLVLDRENLVSQVKK